VGNSVLGTLGIIDFWTPKAAKQALWVAQKATETFAQIGSMTPSKSSLDRLRKKLSEVWEASREGYEAALRDALVVPEGAVSVAVSIDGVLAPIDGGKRPVDVRDAAAQEGRNSKGPRRLPRGRTCDADVLRCRGRHARAIRIARAPAPNKRTLKASLAAELCAALRQAPALKLVKIADGVDDNWSFLAEELPDGVESHDFFHASEHLHAAVAAAYGDGTIKTRHRYEELRETLRDEPGGVRRVIRALDYLRKQHPRAEHLRRCAAYFRKHRHRMDYAGLKADGLPIGSGLVEAACNTLVAQRLKLSGMRWGARCPGHPHRVRLGPERPLRRRLDTPRGSLSGRRPLARQGHPLHADQAAAQEPRGRMRTTPCHIGSSLMKGVWSSAPPISPAASSIASV
jgi:hypothetical protein